MQFNLKSLAVRDQIVIRRLEEVQLLATDIESEVQALQQMCNNFAATVSGMQPLSRRSLLPSWQMLPIQAGVQKRPIDGSQKSATRPKAFLLRFRG